MTLSVTWVRAGLLTVTQTGTPSEAWTRAVAALPLPPSKIIFQTFHFHLTNHATDNDNIGYIVKMQISAKDLADLAARKISKVDLAARLGVSHTYLVRITPTLPPGPVSEQRRANATFAASRKAFRVKLAKQVEQGTKSIEKAAQEARCSTRTMYRYLCTLPK